MSQHEIFFHKNPEYLEVQICQSMMLLYLSPLTPELELLQESSSCSWPRFQHMENMREDQYLEAFVFFSPPFSSWVELICCIILPERSTMSTTEFLAVEWCESCGIILSCCCSSWHRNLNWPILSKMVLPPLRPPTHHPLHHYCLMCKMYIIPAIMNSTGWTGWPPKEGPPTSRRRLVAKEVQAWNIHMSIF